MLDKQTKPLEIAQAVLKPETIQAIKAAQFSNQAYLILDRWAMNTPETLKALEKKGELSLIVRLDQQHTLEHRTLISDSARIASQTGMSDWEILQEAGIEMNLLTTELLH